MQFIWAYLFADGALRKDDTRKKEDLLSLPVES